MEHKNDSSVGDFILQLYLILVGVAFGFSIENLLGAEITLSAIFRFLTVVVMLIIWLHGQVGYGLSETYEVEASWVNRVFENYIEVANIILVMTAAIVLNREIIFYFVVLAVYAFDLLLEIFYVLRIRKVKETYKREYEVALSWVYENLSVVILMVPLIILRIEWVHFSELLASLGIFIIVIVNSFWDYSYNRDFYFGLPKFERRKMKKREK